MHEILLPVALTSVVMKVFKRLGVIALRLLHQWLYGHTQLQLWHQICLWHNTPGHHLQHWWNGIHGVGGEPDIMVSGEQPPTKSGWNQGAGGRTSVASKSMTIRHGLNIFKARPKRQGSIFTNWDSWGSFGSVQWSFRECRECPDLEHHLLVRKPQCTGH